MHRRNCLGWLAALAAGTAMPKKSLADRPPLRIGLTPVILANQVAFLSRWSRYLGEHCGHQVGFIARDSYQAILDLLFSGHVDAAWICGYPFVRHARELKLLAVPTFDGEPLYRAYLIRSKRVAPDIHGWADLRDRVLAYSDPLSNSGWLVAQVELDRAGLAPGELRRAFFAHGHRNVAEAVAAGLAHAGAIDGYVWETMRAQGMAAIAATEVIWRSKPYGFPPLVTLGEHADSRIPALRDALFAMPDDPVGRELLGSLNLTGFVPGAEAMFEAIHRQALGVPGSGVTN